jgi:hypothetical protein
MFEQTFKIEYKSGAVDLCTAGLSEYIAVEKEFGKPIGSDAGITTMAFMAYSAAKSAHLDSQPKKPFLPFEAWHKTVKGIEVVANDEVNPTEPAQSEG